MGENIFRKSSLDRISSPEQLNDYIRVSNPSVWLMLFAILAMIAGVLIWGFFGVLPTTLTLTAYCEDGVATFYLSEDQARMVEPGMPALVDGVQGKVDFISEHPLSLRETNDLYADDYTRFSLNLSDWNTEARVAIPAALNGLLQVKIEAASVRPIDFLFN